MIYIYIYLFHDLVFWNMYKNKNKCKYYKCLFLPLLHNMLHIYVPCMIIVLFITYTLIMCSIVPTKIVLYKYISKARKLLHPIWLK